MPVFNSTIGPFVEVAMVLPTKWTGGFLNANFAPVAGPVVVVAFAVVVLVVRLGFAFALTLAATDGLFGFVLLFALGGRLVVGAAVAGGGGVLEPVPDVVAATVVFIVLFVAALIDPVVIVPKFEIFIPLFSRNNPLFRNVIIFALVNVPLCCCV